MKEITLKSYVNNEAVQVRIKEVLKDNAQQFIVSLLSTVNSNAAIAECDPPSVLNAAMTAASLDLPINQNLGFAYIVPYNVKQKDGSYKKLAQFQMGYKGFIQLAQRSSQVRTINVTDVREGEIVDTDMLTGDITFAWLDRKNREAKNIIGFVSYIELLNGFKKSLYMTVEDLRAHGTKYSQIYKKYKTGLWADNFDSMAEKTVVKLLLSKYAPLTTAMQKAILADQSVIDGENNYIYPDNKKLTAVDVAREKERGKVITHIGSSTTTVELQSCEETVIDMQDDELKKLYDAKYDLLQKVS